MPHHRPLLVLAAALFLVGCAENPPPRPTAAQIAHACMGISDAQACAVLGELRRDVDSVRVARERTNTKPFLERTVGADIHVRATSGVNAPWLMRLLQCHAIRDASGAPCESASCPLAAGRIAIDVSPTGSGYFIAIRSSDVDVAREVARRAEALLAPPRIEHRIDATPLTATLR